MKNKLLSRRKTQDKYSIERKYITKLLVERDKQEFLESKITEYFFEGDDKNVFSLIVDRFKNSKEIVTIDYIQDVYPSYKFAEYENEDGEIKVGALESLSFCADELRLKVKQNLIAELMNEIGDAFDKEDRIKSNTLDRAIKLMRETLIDLDVRVEGVNEINLNESKDRIKEQYKRRKENKGISGVTTGITQLDNMLKGLQPETLTTIFSKSAVGKTWFEILIGIECMLNNYTVMQVTTEMSDTIMEDRYMSLLFAKIEEIKFKYEDYKTGRLDTETEKIFNNFLDKRLNKMQDLIIVTGESVSQIESKYEKYKPDIIIIDGAYLLQDDNGASEDWLRVTNITRDLKKLAKKLRIPILINTQADNVKTVDRKGRMNYIGLEHIKYSQSTIMDSDNVVALFRSPDMIKDGRIGLRVLKNREGTLGNILITWDFNTMDFGRYIKDIDDDLKYTSDSLEIDEDEIIENDTHKIDIGDME